MKGMTYINVSVYHWLKNRYKYHLPITVYTCATPDTTRLVLRHDVVLKVLRLTCPVLIVSFKLIQQTKTKALTQKEYKPPVARMWFNIHSRVRVTCKTTSHKIAHIWNGSSSVAHEQRSRTFQLLQCADRVSCLSRAVMLCAVVGSFCVEWESRVGELSFVLSDRAFGDVCLG